MNRFLTPVFPLVIACSALAAEPVDYVRDIKPILKERCYSCHGALKQNAKLRLDTVALMARGGKNGPALVRGKPDDSLFLERVSDPDESTRMPPEGKPLTAEQLARIKTWIEQGANAPADEKPEEDPRAHWAFRKPVRPPLPSVADPAWNPNPVDRFIAAEHAKRKLKPADEADKSTILRRVFIDLIGLPPTRDELHAFLADTSTNAYEKVVDRLLASPQYGERWARHWMDVWRYSDWYGRRSVPDVLNSYGQIWRWRDWIVRGVAADRGYDEMVRLMLAADEIAPANLDESVATGFLVRNFFRWNYNNWMRDNVEHTAKAFLGLTLNCCHCHDHKYDPIAQEEYFKFRAIFEPLEIRHDRWPGEPDPGPYPKYSYGASYKPITSGMVRVMDEKLDAKTHFYTGGDERNIAKEKPPIPPGVPALLGGLFKFDTVTLPPEAWYPGLRDHVRREELTKREQAVASAEAALAKAATPQAAAQLAVARADLDALRIRIAADDIAYRGVKGDAGAAARAAGLAEARHKLDLAILELAQKEAALAATKNTANEKAVADAKARVDAAAQALKNPPSTYTPLSPIYPKTSSGRRKALANWLTSRDNPLTARVAVNHIWNWHFGRPLVETTMNFGRSGKTPSHPELLDWMAVEFMENGWKAKPLHRLIVTSRAYRMASGVRKQEPEVRSQDPDNIYLTRFPTNRMEAEVVRDSLLHLAGELDPAMGGVEISQDQAMTSKRRSIYLAHHGETRAQFLDLFDAANPCDAYRRTISVLPQQALALSNSELAVQLARTLAKKLPARDDELFVTAAFEQVLARPPRPAERTASMAFLTQQRKLFEAELKGSDPTARARENLVQTLFNHTDFVTVR
jgi:hypothetical protein